MKAIWVLSVLLLASCGEYDQPNDSQLGTMNSLQPLEIKTGSSEHTKIKEICDAIAAKTVTISSLVNTDYTFSGTLKNCTDTEFTNIADSTVRLVNQSGSYKFAEGVNLFYFSDVETSDEGVLSLICDKIDNLSSPIPLDSSSVSTATSLLYFTSKNLSPSDCSEPTDEKCIKIERATKVTTETEGDKGRVHTREWIRTKMVQPNLGFFTYKKRNSEASCVEGFYFGRTATLK